MLFQIDGAAVVQNIQLSAHDDIDAVGFGADHLEIAEIKLMERARHGRRMVGDTDQLQPFFPAGGNHLAQCAVGMYACDGMHMDIKQIFHGNNLPTK